MLARLLILMLAILLSAPAAAERRVALVIGNSAYQHAPSLKNSSRDARAVSETLSTLDFEVQVETNLDKIGLERTMERFAQLSKGADVALLYFAGHAIQVK